MTPTWKAGHTNTIDGLWKQLKRAWYGAHTKYSPAYANAYAAEACYKWNNRGADDLFDRFLRRVCSG